MERDLAKVEAAGSSPVSRFFYALKSVLFRFWGIFFMVTMQNCYFSYYMVCDKIMQKSKEER